MARVGGSRCERRIEKDPEPAVAVRVSPKRTSPRTSLPVSGGAWRGQAAPKVPQLGWTY